MNKKMVPLAIAAILGMAMVVPAFTHAAGNPNESCIRAAMDARGTATQNAFTAYTNAVSAASSTWMGIYNSSSSPEAYAAMGAVWATYNASLQTAQANLKSAQSDAQAQFIAATRACHS